MRTLPIAFVCCLSAASTFAMTETGTENTMSTSEATTGTTGTTPTTPEPQSAMKGANTKPTTYMHTDDSSNSTNKMSQMVMTTPAAKAMASSDCLITIRNDGITDLVVYGRFDDGTYLNTFTLPWLGSYVTYIDLYYYGYCHGGMDFYIDTVGGTYKYNGYTPVGKTIRIK